MVDLSTNLNGLTLKNPVLGASGTYGYNNEFDAFLDIQNLGAVVTKAITLIPRLGNEGMRICETYGGMINSIGLENVGVERFMQEKLPVLINEKIPFFVNLAGSTMQEYIELAKICEKHSIPAIELNVSCPNVKSGCLEFGTDEKTLYELVSSVRQEFSGHILTKLTPNVTTIERIAVAAQKAGSNAISAINTLKALAIKLSFTNGQFDKQELQGGLSGTAIKPVALGAVKRIAKEIDIPIVAIGGISNFDDMLEFFAIGAEAVQVGTANFTMPNACETIVNDLTNFLNETNISSLDELKRLLRKD